MIIAGLTGSIATGKSTVGQMFQAFNIPVYEADHIVHDIYTGPLASQIEEVFPGTLINGQIDRTKLGKYVLGDTKMLEKLERLIHPLVRQKFAEIAKNHRQSGTDLIIFDIPLLLEKGVEKARELYAIDKIIVTFCAPEAQQQRALARPHMSQPKLDNILAQQMPQDQKRALADFTLDTGKSLDTTRIEVKAIVDILLNDQPHHAEKIT